MNATILFASALVAIVAYLSTRTPERELTIDVISIESLLSPGIQEVSSASFLVNGTIVANPSRVVFDLKSTGRAPIRAGDYETPLRVRIPDAKIVQADIVLRQPPDLHCEVRLNGEILEIVPGLMNSREGVRFVVLYDGTARQLIPSGRIVGAAAPEVSYPDDPLSQRSDWIKNILPAPARYLLVALSFIGSLGGMVIGVIFFWAAVFGMGTSHKDQVQSTCELSVAEIHRLAEEHGDPLVAHVLHALARESHDCDGDLEDHLSRIVEREIRHPDERRCTQVAALGMLREGPHGGAARAIGTASKAMGKSINASDAKNEFRFSNSKGDSVAAAVGIVMWFIITGSWAITTFWAWRYMSL